MYCLLKTIEKQIHKYSFYLHTHFCMRSLNNLVASFNCYVRYDLPLTWIVYFSDVFSLLFFMLHYFKRENNLHRDAEQQKNFPLTVWVIQNKTWNLEKRRERGRFHEKSDVLRKLLVKKKNDSKKRGLSLLKKDV